MLDSNKIKNRIFHLFGIRMMGLIPVSMLVWADENTVSLLRKLTFKYFQYYADHVVSINDLRRQESIINKKSVYILANTIPMFSYPVSSHVKVVGDIAKIFTDQGISVSLVLAVHPFVGVYNKTNFKINNYLREQQSQIESLLYKDFKTISGLNSGLFSVCILGVERSKIYTLRNYIDFVIDSIEFGSNDLIFSLGGKYGSDLFHELMRKVTSKKIYLMMNAENRVDDRISNAYDAVIAAVPDAINSSVMNELKVLKNRNRLSPFYWEKDGSIRLSSAEHKILYDINKSHRGKLVVATMRNMSTFLTDDYANILHYLIETYDIKVLFIGDDRRRIESALDVVGINKADIFVLPFSANLYSFYSEIKKEFDVYYAFPRTSGGGYGSIFAVLAGIPVVFFNGNDTESVLPAYCFEGDYKGYLNRICKLIEDPLYRKHDIVSVRQFIEKRNLQVDEFYLNLLAKEKSLWDYC